jgi:HEAT repeat protein
LLGRLSYLEDPRAAHSLLPLLQDPVPEVRKQACLALGRLDDLTVVGALKTSLQDPEPSVRLGAAASLVQLGDGTGFVVLLEGATSPDPRLRLAAIGPLASVATPAAAQVLRDLAADADPGVRQAAHSALLGSGEPSSVRSALLGFEDPDWRARQHLAHIAGVLRVSAAADTLLDRLTHDESASVRVAAGIALANLGDRRAVPQLLTGLESPSEMERCGAANALGILGVKEAATPLTALLEDEAAGVRRAARLALLRILEDCPDCPK